MIWIIPLVLAAAVAYSLVWFLLNRKLSPSDDAENITKQSMEIMSRSLFKRRGILSGMIFTGQSRRLNQNNNQPRHDLKGNAYLSEMPFQKTEEPETEPVNPPSGNDDSHAPDEGKDNTHDTNKPSE